MSTRSTCRWASTALLLVALAGCATAPGGAATSSIYNTDRERLLADCQARGGFLQPTNRFTGQATLDYTCEIRGAAQPLRP